MTTTSDTENNNNTSKLICVGIITAAHGIKGAVKIRSYTQNPEDIVNYSPLFSKDKTQQFSLKLISVNGDFIIASVNDIKTRNDAEFLSSTELYIYRDMLPEVKEDEFYYEDLVGLKVLHAKSSKVIGKVIAIYNHGAGDIIEIMFNENGKSELYAFTKKNIPTINVKEGFITLQPPEVEFFSDNDNE